MRVFRIFGCWLRVGKGYTIRESLTGSHIGVSAVGMLGSWVLGSYPGTQISCEEN